MLWVPWFALVLAFAAMAPAQQRIPFPMDPAALLQGNAPGIDLPLRQGRFAARRTWWEVRGGGDFSWAGKMEGSGGDIVLTVKHGRLRGLIQAPEGTYEIRPSGRGHALVPVTPIDDDCLGAVDPAGDDAAPVRSATAVPFASDKPLLTESAGPTIDVLVAYTEAARVQAGGREELEADIQSMVDATNASFRNSGLSASLRLAGLLALDWTGVIPVTQSEHLRRLARDETVARHREELHADLVSLLVGPGDGEESACGVGYLLTERNKHTGSAGFTVVKRSCGLAQLTFTHELGHNFGLNHDPANGPAPAAAFRPYGFGHFVDGLFRTVMSYSAPCRRGCRRVPHFSNPEIAYEGEPTGIAEERDNARVLRENVSVVARFRSAEPQ